MNYSNAQLFQLLDMLVYPTIKYPHIKGRLPDIGEIRINIAHTLISIECYTALEWETVGLATKDDNTNQKLMGWIANNRNRIVYNEDVSKSIMEMFNQ